MQTMAANGFTVAKLVQSFVGGSACVFSTVLAGPVQNCPISNGLAQVIALWGFLTGILVLPATLIV